MVIITKVILAVEKIEQKYGCSFSIIMSMSLVLGQGEPGDMPGEARNFCQLRLVM